MGIWGVVGQQLMTAAVLVVLTVTHRALTGRTAKGLADAPTGTDLVVWGGTVVLLVWLSRWWVTRAGAARGIGLALTRRRLAHVGLGFAAGACLNALPWAVPLLRDTAHRVSPQPAATAGSIIIGLAIALSTALVEETTSRGAPLALLERWPAWASAAVTALCFALLHGVGETLHLTRLAYLWSLGVVLACCWRWTGSVWLGTGAHAGWFWASLVPSGRTRAGALFAIDGDLGAALALADTLLMASAVLLIGWLWFRDRGADGRPTRRALAAVVLLLGGCSRPAPGVPVDGTALRPWRQLEGRWRGTLNDTAPFFEQYHFEDDSTVAITTLTSVTDSSSPVSGRLTRRAGRLYSGSDSVRWVADAYAPESLVFAPLRGASNRFRWVRRGPDAWTAIIEWRDRAGQLVTRRYEMRRVW